VARPPLTLAARFAQVRVVSLGFRTDLMLRRLAGASVTDRGDHVVVQTPSNPAFYWGNFLLLAEPPAAGAGARWLDVFAAEFPSAQHVAIGIDGVDGQTGDVAELLAARLELETSIVLTAERLTPSTAPSTSDVRPLRTDADWAQASAVRLTLDEDDSPAHREFVERKMAEARQLTLDGYGEYFGVFVDGVVRGSLGVMTDGSGVARYQNVETHPEHRRQGHARAMLRAAADTAIERFGARTLVILADPEYVAIDLYRGLGFVDSERQVQLQRAPDRG
jgi:ribosomal protein S18 acetylase RimI-like enzyme